MNKICEKCENEIASGKEVIIKVTHVLTGEKITVISCLECAESTFNIPKNWRE